MTQENIKSFEKEVFKKKLSALISDGKVSDADFSDTVYTAISRFGIGEDDFRTAFGLTAGAVERWTQGQNLPQAIIRPKIISWISEHLSQKAT